MNEYSTKVRNAVLETMPHLEQHMKESQSGTLVIRVPHPRISSGLVITTDGDEITIGFRTWHTHGELLTAAPEAQIGSALTFVKQILDGDVQLAVSYVNGEFVDAWVSDDPVGERRYLQPNEQLVIGTWAQLAA